MNWDDLLAGIKAGHKVEDLVDALRPRPLQQVLRRAALVRSFDRDTFDRVLRGDVGESVDFTTLMKSDAIERVPQGLERYRLRSALGRRFLSQWTNDPEGMRAASAALATYYRSRGPGARLELLRQLAVTEPLAARRLFDELFDEANARFDLARCTEVIDALGDRLSLIPADLAAWRDDRRLYLEARGLFADDYYRTAHLLDRAALKAAVETLFTDPERWILQLHAAGGMGKTMFLRGLIARRCVPSRIPVARIDFDFAERGAQPWRLLARLAEQLNRQMANAPFAEIVLKVAEADSLPAADAEVHWRSLASDVPPRFIATLGDLRLTGPVLIVVDTLEEALLHQGSDVLGLVNLLADVHTAAAPSVRLILSGRYDLLDEARLPGFAASYRTQTIDQELARLTNDESRQFLIGTRRVADDERLAVVVERAEGSPFKLALFADLLAASPELTAERIRAYPSVDVTYLIERVVDRIDDKRVRWLVRYGVVPRHLTLGFVREVMARYLGLAMSSEVQWDAPARDLPEALRRLDVFPRGLPGVDHLDLDALWRTLAAYGGAASWVTAGQGAETLVFHGDVVNPMRRLLQNHGIFEMLHRDAAVYYEKRAADEPHHRARHLREALYHRFQLEGAAAAPYWETLIARARIEGKVALQRSLADEVTGSEYVEDGRPRARNETTLMIALATLARAYLEFAAATVWLAGIGELAGGWAEARRALAAAEKTAADAHVTLPAVRVAFVRAALQANAADPDAALATLDAAGALTAPALDRLELEEARGGLLMNVNRPGAEDAFHAALEAASECAASPTTRVRLQSRLALAQAERGRLRAARETCLAILAGGDAVAAGFAEGTLLLAQVELWRASPSATLALSIPESVPQDASVVAALWLKTLRVIALRDLRRPFEAGAEMASLRELPSDDERGAAMVEEAGAAVDDAVFRDTSALQALDRARSRWSRIGRPDGVARIIRRSIEVQLRAGNLQGADLLLQEVRTLGLPPRSEEAMRFELIRAEVLHRHGAIDDALGLLGLPPDSAAWPPRIRVWIAVTTLKLLPEAQRTGARLRALVAALVNALDAMDDVSARLRLLDGLEQCPMVVGSGGIGRTSPLARALARLVRRTTAANDRLPERDTALLTLRRVEVHRILGEHTAARQALDEAETLLAHDAVPFAMRDVFLARDRLGWGPDGPPDRPETLERLIANAGNYPMLIGVVALEHAERLARAGRADERWASSARQYLGEQGFTGWHARMDELASLRVAQSDPERARALRLRAALTWERLGDRLASERVRVEPPASPRANDRAPTPDIAPGDDTVIVRMSEESGALRVYFDGNPVASPMSRDPIVTDLLSERLDIAEAARRKWIGRLASDWRSVAHDFGLLTGFARVGRVGATVRLEIAPLPLQELPWELLVAPQHSEPVARVPDVRVFHRAGPPRLAETFTVRWVQQALTLLGAHLTLDGVAGPQTRRALQDFQRSTGLEATGVIDPLLRQALEARLRELPPRHPVVIVLRPSREHAERAFRGTQSLGGGVESAYQALGKVIEIDDPRLLEKVPLAQAAIIHVTGRFHDSPTRGGVLVDIGGGESGKTAIGEPISVARFDDALFSGTAQPLVILDATRPEGASETLRQLFLRNAFAADLFARRRVAAVLATGLGDYTHQRTMFTILRALLEQGATLGEIALELRRTAGSLQLLDVLPSVGTALFAHDPELRPMLGAAAP